MSHEDVQTNVTLSPPFKRGSRKQEHIHNLDSPSAQPSQLTLDAPSLDGTCLDCIAIQAETPTLLPTGDYHAKNQSGNRAWDSEVSVVWCHRRPP